MMKERDLSIRRSRWSKSWISAAAGLLALLSASGASVANADQDGRLIVKPRYADPLLSVGSGDPALTLTPYGQANFTTLFSDDGQERDAFVVDNNPSSSRLGIIARLDPGLDWKLGFQYEAGFDIPGSTTVRATDESRTRPFIDGDDEPFTRLLHGWIDSPYGRLTIGESLPVIANWTPNPGRTFATDQAGFFLIGGGFNPVISNPSGGRSRIVRPWSAFTAPMQWPLTQPILLFRYDTPSIGGVTFSAAKAQTDIFDVGVRYKGDVSRFAVDASLAWHKNQAPDYDSARIGFPEFEEALVGGIGLRDRPTGLFGVVGANYRMFDGSNANDFDGDGARRPDDFGLWGQLGLRRNLLGIGDTVVYGVVGYGHDRGEGRFVPGTAGARWLETRVVMAGINVLQEIDAARKLGTRLDLYAGYRQWRGDFLRTTAAADPTPFREDADPLHLITGGFRLRF